MKLLLAHGADVSAKAGHYGSALTTALAFCQIDAARLLILNAADVNMVDKVVSFGITHWVPHVVHVCVRMYSS